MKSRPGRRSSAEHRDDRGVTLIEVVATAGLILVVLALVAPALTTVMAAASSVRATSSTVGKARLAVEDLAAVVSSAAQVCLPTEMTATGPTVPSGFGLRAETLASGGDKWVQFFLDPVSGDLVEQQWPTTWVSGDPVPPLLVVATGVAASPQSPPFSLLPSTAGSPVAVEVSLVVGAKSGRSSQEVPIASTIAALDTPYAPSPPAQPCATTKD